MQPQHTHIALPLEQFFAQLHAAGFRMDTARKMRLLRALKSHGAEHIGNVEQLKYALAPFVATTPEEQRRFYEFFDAFYRDCELEADKWADGETDPGEPPSHKPPPPGFWKKHRWWLALLPALLAAWFAAPYIKNWLTPLPPSLPPARIEYAGPDDNIRREGQQKPFKNATTDIHPDSCRWEVRDAETGALEHADTALHLDWAAQGYGSTKKIILNAGTRGKDSMQVNIHCANPPAMPLWTAPESPLLQGREYEFAVAPKEKNARVQWFLQGSIGGGIRRDTTIWATKIRYAFEGNGPASVTCKVYFNEKNCYAEEVRSYTVGTDKPMLPLADLRYDTPRTEARLKIWVWLLFLLPLLPAGWLIWRWWQKRHEKPQLLTDDELAAKHPLHDKAPYLIPYLPQDGKISTPPDFFRMADVLRRREESEHREVDVPASVRATVDSGGFPTLLERRNTTPPDYLFLVERPSAQDQQGRLFERLTSFFRKQDAPLTVFFHDGNFHSFWSDEKPDGVSLDFLQKQHAGYRLVLIGTGHGLYNPYDTRLPALRRSLLDALQFWKKSLLLSTLPVSGWAAQEVLLHRHFLLYPADTEGIRAGLEALDALEEHEPGPYTKWEETLARHRSDPNPRLQLWDTVEQHRDFLTPRSVNEGGSPSNGNLSTFIKASAGKPTTSNQQPTTNNQQQTTSNQQQTTNNQQPPTGNQQPTTNNQQPTSDFKWLCGLAVSVLPDFSLTVAIGKKMGLEVTHDSLLRLSRIPWLNQNEPDHYLRLALLAQLSPEEERLAREAVAEELEAVRKNVVGGYAELDWKTSLAIHRFALDPQHPEHRQTLRELMQLGLLSEGQLRELDGLVQRRLEPGPDGEAVNQSHHLTAPAGTRFAAYLDRKLFFTPNMVWALLLTALSLGMLAWGWWQQRQWQQQAEPPASMLAQQEAVVDSALLWHNEAVRMALKIRAEEEYVVWAGTLQDTARAAGRLFRMADSLSRAESVASPLRDTNYLHFQLNMAAQQFNFFLSQVPFMEAATLAAAEEYRLAQGRLGGLFSVDSLLLNLSKSENRSASLTALHGHGICQFYFHQYARIPGSLDSALLAYHDILRRTDSLYFDTLSTMPVNLQTLLAAENAIELAASIVLRGQMLDAATNGYLPEGIYQRAVVSAEGLPYGYLLNNGQFRVDLPGSWKAPVRLFVRAPGYRPAEMTVLPQDFDKAIVVRLVADTVTAAVQDPPPSTQNTAQILADINRSMVRIQGGTFTMGCLDEKRDGSCADTEKPYRDVTLGDYYIGATEVTIEQYLIFCDETKTHYPEWLEPGNEYNIETGTNDYYKRRGMSRENKKHPITGVSWNDAVAYCEWLSKKTGQPYRLPTEAEWEYAARGGIAWKDGLRYAGSNNIDEVAWYEGNSGSQTHPVAGKKPNQRGLYDMSGNVWEWCQDVWHDNYQGAPLDGRAWMDGGSSGTAVLRGGSWYGSVSYCRPASRFWLLRDVRGDYLGFRLARAASAGGR